ncbi:MAG TPA: hypothetical protein VNH18_29410, partial [Bryobacteraceae bacterium]|nr:hypothetical protein [Bryobacteraceae bacterium]
MPDKKVRAQENIQKLAAQKYPPAMSLVGMWMVEGSEMPKEEAGGVEFVRKAADTYDPHGLLVLGMLYAKGVGVPAHAE